MRDAAARHALVFAIAHELGNHLAGIRLEAHLLDEDLAPHALARASLAIDALAGQSGPLLALLRPLLAPVARSDPGPGHAALLEGVRRQILDEGAGGRAVEVEIDGSAGFEGPGFEGLHALLLALVGSPGTLPAAGPIRLRLARREREVELACELPGEAFDDVAEVAVHALRGRPLAVAIARVLVGDAGGRVELSTGPGGSRVALILPTA